MTHHHLESVTMANEGDWTWNLAALLVLLAVMSALLLPAGRAGAEAVAAEPTEAAPVAHAIVPSPQPGEGEPELVVADLPQSY